MIKIIFCVLWIGTGILCYDALSTQTQIDIARSQIASVHKDNAIIVKNLTSQQGCAVQKPLEISAVYVNVIRQINILAQDSATVMQIQLDKAKEDEARIDQENAVAHRGVKVFKIQVTIDSMTPQTDMGMILDGIHRIENSSDFIVSAISKDSNHCLVQGEIYGV